MFVRYPTKYRTRAPNKAGYRMYQCWKICNLVSWTMRRAMAPPGGCTAPVHSMRAIVVAMATAFAMTVYPRHFMVRNPHVAPMR